MRGGERLRAATQVLRGHPVKYRYSELGDGMRRLCGLIGRSPSVIDVGANVGSWTRQLLGFCPRARVLMIEAQCEHGATLREFSADKPNLDYEIATLDSRRGKITTLFLVGEGPRTGTSLREELTAVPFRTREVITDTLDDVCAEKGFRHPIDCMKLDTQGSELDILRGGQRTLRATRYLVLECSLVRYNESAPLLEEVIKWCTSEGFVVRDILDRRYRANDLLQCDVLFAQDRASLH